MRKLCKKPFWKMRDNTEISIDDMETSHIENALAMLQRKGFIGPSTLIFYLTCPEPTGEMAGLAFDEEFQNVIESPVSKFVDLFEDELKRRKKLKTLEEEDYEILMPNL